MSKSKIKSFILAIPVFGYLVRIVQNVIRFPKIYDQMIKQDTQLNSFVRRQADFENELNKSNEALTNTVSIQENMRQQFSVLEQTAIQKDVKASFSDDAALFADDHIMDKFYKEFEDRFRGDESLIYNRLKVYVPYFTSSKIKFEDYPVLDIGSGRGEFLTLLKKNNVRSIGLDINGDMVKRSEELGLEVVQGDALNYLIHSKSQAFGAITGFHFVEHIPFNVLMRVLDNAHRCLVSNGFVVFETPNPENLTVGSTTFYMDPSHLHPIPPQLLAFALEVSGFKQVEILRLHNNKAEAPTGLQKKVRDLMFGSRDYAVIGYK